MPGPRAYVGEMLLAIGPVTTVGRLVPVLMSTRNEVREYRYVCPACDDPTIPTQGYSCPNGHGPFPASEMHRAKVLDDKLAKVSVEEYDAARTVTDLPLNTFRATVVDAESFEALTWDAANAYVFQPRQVDEHYGLLLRMLEESEGKAFISVANLQNNEGFYRLALWAGNIVVQKVMWPDEVNHFDAPRVTVSDESVDAALAMLDRITVEFQPEQFTSQVKAQLAALAESLEVGERRVATRRSTESNQNSLVAMLNGFGQVAS